MDAIELQYTRIRQKYPDAPDLEIWQGVAMDFYLRTGDVPEDVLVRSALARAETYGVKYRPDQLRVPAGNPDGEQWMDEGGGGARQSDRQTARVRTPNRSATRRQWRAHLLPRRTRRKPIATISCPAINSRSMARRLFRRQIVGDTILILKRKSEAPQPAEEDMRLKGMSGSLMNR